MVVVAVVICTYTIHCSDCIPLTEQQTCSSVITKLYWATYIPTSLATSGDVIISDFVTYLKTTGKAPALNIWNSNDSNPTDNKAAENNQQGLNKLRVLSLRANYTDRATAACRRS
jgi:hypothetical protein